MKLSINNKFCNSIKMKVFVGALFFILLFSAVIGTTHSQAALKVRYNGKLNKYNGKQVKSYLDGKTIKADGTKGLVLNKTLMVSYKDVFKKACKAKTTYNSKTGKIVIKDNGVTVKMKVGSKNATVNGKKTKLKQAPIKVKYVKKKKTKVLVPAKYVAKALGYKYTYNKNDARLDLTSPFVLIYNKKYNIYKSYFGGLVYDNTTIDISTMPIFKLNGSVMMPAKHIFADIMGIGYTYDGSSGEITIANDFYKVTLNTNNNVAKIYDNDSGNTSELAMKTKPLIVKRKDSGYTDVMVPASSVVQALGYYYKWDSSLKICNIHTATYFDWKQKDVVFDNTLYSNALTGIKTTYDITNNTIVLSVTFANNIDESSFVITEDDMNNMFYLDVAGCINLLSDKNYTMSGQNINVISSDQSSTGARVTLMLHNPISQYHSVSGNTINIYITEGWKTDYGLRITKPDYVTFEQFTLEDRYYENKFIISVPGNLTEFFAANPIVIKSANISSYNVELVNNMTNIVVNTKKLQGCKLVNLGNIIGVIVDEPHNVFDNIVVLDPGHGGKDPGAQNKGVNESDLNFKILYEYGKEYFNSPDSPVKAYWTRVNDTYITLDDRAKFASKIGADIFVSLHMNSATNTSAKGTEVYYSTLNNNVTSFGLTSNSLASKCLYKITPAVSTAVRGVKSANYYVIRYNSVPAVLIELGFMTNSSDFKTITNANSQKAAAKAIYDSVVESFAGR
ncbi:MAG: hypothetical protein HFH14_04870 [Lachnospiraceae bacterium]|nr:hypothetical protein [Lachnospiraceae bacterium]